MEILVQRIAKDGSLLHLEQHWWDWRGSKYKATQLDGH